jgi:serine/threonine-protein kinase RIO1
VIEHPFEPRVPALGHPRGNFDSLLLLRVVVDVEVIGLQDLEIEVLVLDLVAAEVLSRRVARDDADEQNGENTEGKESRAFHGNPAPMQSPRRQRSAGAVQS